jgi:hypothetical protein
MRQSIRLEVTHPSAPPGRIDGFRFVWAFYVRGYRPDRHCQPCFKGRRVEEFCTPTALSGRTYELNRLDRYPYVYVCGVGQGPKTALAQQNLHFPLRYVQGAIAEATTYNGYIVRAMNAERLIIPPLPEGWRGKSREHVRCKNFQFAVEYFGPPPDEGSDPRGD